MIQLFIKEDMYGEIWSRYPEYPMTNLYLAMMQASNLHYNHTIYHNVGNYASNITDNIIYRHLKVIYLIVHLKLQLYSYLGFSHKNTSPCSGRVSVIFLYLNTTPILPHYVSNDYHFLLWSIGWTGW